VGLKKGEKGKREKGEKGEKLEFSLSPDFPGEVVEKITAWHYQGK